MTNTCKILVIGLGEIGYNNAEFFSSLGLWVDGFDINKAATQRALKEKIIKKEAESFRNYDFYIICISTHKPLNMFMPELDGLYQVIKRISREGKEGALLGIDSTIPRGTTEDLDKILGHKMHIVHVPHRYYSKEKKEHGVSQLRVIGAPRQCCYAAGTHFYGKMLGIPLHQVSSPEVAEMTKITENSHRFVEIAFAEELKMLCDKTGINFSELKNAVNTKWNTKILDAYQGIGGHCLPKDSQMLLDISRLAVSSSIIEAAKKIDLQYREHIRKDEIQNIASVT